MSVVAPVLKNPEAAVPPAKLAVLNRAVLDACDGADGVKDGFLNEPRACKFDPAVLQCKGADAESCLTAAQVASVKRADWVIASAWRVEGENNRIALAPMLEAAE